MQRRKIYQSHVGILKEQFGKMDRNLKLERVDIKIYVIFMYKELGEKD